MTHETLRAAVYNANMELAASGLVMGTFGNLSAVDRAAGVFAIKPSGMPYGELKPADMVIVSLADGGVIDSGLRPSSDTPTHLELYRAFDCGAIVHTHSEYATMFAHARMPIRCMGTTHADYFRGDIPVTRPMRRDEVEQAYERNTGLVIAETFAAGLSASDVQAVLVANHGPFTWGADAATAIEHARVLEYLARLEWRVRTMAPDAPVPDRFLIDKHYLRKHGPKAYYGQK
ncbi:MAG TPA: L-ribulose-5-phosphate 4-epimerase AraD [Vicinamibacterales bacterium]|nr:L-ribulose-5-phosphate 4-epimerase AraD [Vicinamibacterales bacterium]